MIDGIVLAGGYSSRANTNKMCLDFNGKPLIMNTIETMHQVCENIIVVTGYYHDELYSILSAFDYITIVYNEKFEEGMFSSIKKGVAQVENSFFIIPGDYPLVEKETYQLMLGVGKDLVVPSYQRKLGHPIFFDISYKKKLLITEKQNLKAFRNQFNFTILNVNDKGILQDIDDIQDYHRLIGKE